MRVGTVPATLAFGGWPDILDGQQKAFFCGVFRALVTGRKIRFGRQLVSRFFPRASPRADASRLFGAAMTYKIRHPKVAAGAVIFTLLVLLSVAVLTGLTDTRDWLQFAFPSVLFAFVAFWALRCHVLTIPGLLRVDGAMATISGWLAVVVSIVSGYFAVVVFLRWFYS
jgi:hypothetical protein